MPTPVIVALVAALTLLALYVFGTYNELVALRNRCKKAFAMLSQAQSQLAVAQGEEVARLESQVVFARQLFNDSVTNYNAYKHKTPTKQVANLFGHRADASLSGFENT